MAVYGFNENLEKIPIIRLSKTLSCAARDITMFEWDSTALAAAGVKIADLAYYDIVSISYYIGSTWENRFTNLVGFSSGSPAVVSSYSSAVIDTYNTKIQASYYSPDDTAANVTMFVTLLKVA